MSLSPSTETDIELADARHGGLRRVALAGGALGIVLLMGAAGVLWWQHGTTVFFDTLAAGIATCF